MAMTAQTTAEDHITDRNDSHQEIELMDFIIGLEDILILILAQPKARREQLLTFDCVQLAQNRILEAKEALRDNRPYDWKSVVRNDLKEAILGLDPLRTPHLVRVLVTHMREVVNKLYRAGHET